MIALCLDNPVGWARNGDSASQYFVCPNDAGLEDAFARWLRSMQIQRGETVIFDGRVTREARYNRMLVTLTRWCRDMNLVAVPVSKLKRVAHGPHCTRHDLIHNATRRLNRNPANASEATALWTMESYRLLQKSPAVPATSG